MEGSAHEDLRKRLKERDAEVSDLRRQLEQSQKENDRLRSENEQLREGVEGGRSVPPLRNQSRKTQETAKTAGPQGRTRPVYLPEISGGCSDRRDTSRNASDDHAMPVLRWGTAVGAD